MQDEAVARVREMQRRSRSLTAPTAENTPKQPEDPPPEQAKRTDSPTEGLPLFSLGNIRIDEEKALIAMLIYVLYKQGADTKLLLGLGYLLI
jgi:anti-sigma factor RsiW